MKQHVFKLRSELRGKHVRITVFAGFANQTFANCGTLTMDVKEWQRFRVLLLLGTTHNVAPSIVVLEDNQEVKDAIAKRKKGEIG